MPRFAANLSMLFNELAFPERFSAARRAGFEGVEYLFPYAWPLEDVQTWLSAENLTQVLFNLPAGNWDAGERGIACMPDRAEEFRQGVAEAMRYADGLGCRQVNCLAGLQPAGVSTETARQVLQDNVGWAAEQLAREGIVLCLEAINSRVDMPGFMLDTSASVMALIETIGSTNLKLQYDLYHMQIMEGDLIRTLDRLLPYIGHIQFADNPGRHEPGTGEINFPQVFTELDRMGYSGWVGAEYKPRDTTEAGLAWLTNAR